MVQTQSQASGKNANCVEEGTCFIAGTLIQTADGACAIEEIEEGMLVYAADPESGELGLRRVVNTFKKTTNELIHVSVNGEEIVTTPTHPFWRPKHGWTKAVELRAGDILLTSNGEYVVVEQVQHEILEAPVEVYNFEVEDFHTYYVGASSVLVHNKCENKGVGGKGWEGDPTWRRNVKKVSEGGTITKLEGGIPTAEQGVKLIKQGGGTVSRIEGPHPFPNPHTYCHINYYTLQQIKGTLRIQD